MLVAFNANKPLHQELLTQFKQTLTSYQTDETADLLAQYSDYIDTLEIILRNIAVEDLGCLPEVEDTGYWSAVVTNDSPEHFGIICGFEFIDYETDEPEYEYLKCEGNILIEDDKNVVLNIDTASIDFSNSEEFDNYFNA